MLNTTIVFSTNPTITDGEELFQIRMVDGGTVHKMFVALARANRVEEWQQVDIGRSPHLLYETYCDICASDDVPRISVYELQAYHKVCLTY